MSDVLTCFLIRESTLHFFSSRLRFVLWPYSRQGHSEMDIHPEVLDGIKAELDLLEPHQDTTTSQAQKNRQLHVRI